MGDLKDQSLFCQGQEPFKNVLITTKHKQAKACKLHLLICMIQTVTQVLPNLSLVAALGEAAPLAWSLLSLEKDWSCCSRSDWTAGPWPGMDRATPSAASFSFGSTPALWASGSN